MEVASAARRLYLGDPTVAGYVQTRVWKYRLEEEIDGTGRAALVVYANAGWSQGDPVQTTKHPLLYVDCWVDPTRDSMGLVDVSDAEDRAMALASAVTKTTAPKRDIYWGAVGSDAGLHVISSVVWADPTLIPVSGMGQSSPTGATPGGGTSLSDQADKALARVVFALQTVAETVAA